MAARRSTRSPTASVTYSEVSDCGFGNHVRIVSTINGDQVEALYAHMQMNSSPLKSATW